MKKIISLLLIATLSFGLLAGCHAEEGLPLSDKKDLEIRQAYVEYMDWEHTTAEDLSLRAVWYEDGIYAVYIDPDVVADSIRKVLIEDDGEKFEFVFPDSQKLYIYKDKAFYTLKQAYTEGILKTKHLESLQRDDAYENIRFPNAEP